ncbi:MAG: hydantoinase B/oxoprolinase family protein [Deltaproteobacteria bacterium]|nr:hydantoinase B/oxoprolinase family protein [Deltaproteobacteria bacterium]
MCFAAHDFSTAFFDSEGNLVSLSEYIPIHICAAPFAIKAALNLDAGNHLADWSIMVPVFHGDKLRFWSINRATRWIPAADRPGPIIRTRPTSWPRG